MTTNNGPGTSPNQLPESTTAHFGLKVDPYTLDPGSPPFIDPITGEVAQRPHTTHVSPPAVVTSSMMDNGNGSGRYRKSQYKLNSNKLSNPNGPNNGNNPGLGSGYGGHVVVTDTNSFLSAFGSPATTPTTTSTPYDPSNPGLSDQVSYDNFLEACKDCNREGKGKDQSPLLGHAHGHGVRHDDDDDNSHFDDQSIGNDSNCSNTYWWRMVDNNVYSSTVCNNHFSIK